MTEFSRQRITIAVLALGGQGGGVLANWIAKVGEQNGYITQATSVPGVAQRTGSTVYYIEFFPREAAGTGEPVLALMPAPGDVDVVIASELMEAGRSILRGFVSERTTLIASTHREFAISEKAALGDGRVSSERILAAARERSGKFIAFDMNEIAERSGSVISAAMFGALAGSGALPFARETFESTIKGAGKAVESNVAAFTAAIAASQEQPKPAKQKREAPRPTTGAGASLAARITAELPTAAHEYALEGVRRLMDYQDAQYASLYLDRLAAVYAVDSLSLDWALTRSMARHLALWMSYEDTIRVADLKTRAARFARVRSEVGASPDQVLRLTEYMHPRVEEVADTLPPRLGAWLLSSRSSLLRKPFAHGRHVATTSLTWFIILRLLAGLRRFRRSTLRFMREQQHIEEWLRLVRTMAGAGRHDVAFEIVECQRLIKGYGETHSRGFANYSRIVSALPLISDHADLAGRVKELREAALADDEGQLLSQSISRVAA